MSKISDLISRLGKKSWIRFFVVIALVIIADQASKFFIVSNLQPGESIPVISGLFDLSLTFNRGAAFGFLSGLPDGTREIVLTLASTIALLVVLYFLLNEYYSDVIGQIALASVVGGGLGNFIDRCRIGMVVDFLDFYIGAQHWPAFNVADSCICVAVVVLLFRRPKNNA